VQQRREQKRQRAARHEAMVEAQRREAADADARVDDGEGMDPNTANQIRLGKFSASSSRSPELKLMVVVQASEEKMAGDF